MPTNQSTRIKPQNQPKPKVYVRSVLVQQPIPTCPANNILKIVFEKVDLLQKTSVAKC